MEKPKSTHTEVKEPKISVQALADYMAGSERAKRSVVQSCRYRPKARLIQYNEGKLACAQFLRKGDGDLEALREKAEEIRAKLADDDFSISVNEHNADLVKQFADISEKFDLPKTSIERGKDFDSIEINGVKITMRANLLFRRKTKTNKIKIGAAMFRYAKGKSLAKAVGDYQAAGIYGFLRAIGFEDNAEPDKPLCIALDLQSGNSFTAPGDSGNRWSDMKAACATIAERWPNIQPPPNAIF